MFNFFNSISEFFSMIGSLIVNWASSLFNALSVIVQVQSVPRLLTGVLPGIIGSCVWIVFGLGVVKLVLGWGNK